MKRRDFLKIAGTSALSTAIPSSLLSFSQSQEKFSNLNNLLSDEYPFPYDSEYFEAAERFVFLNSHEARINILPKQGKRLDVKLYQAPDKMYLCKTRPISWYNVNESFDIPVRQFFWEPEFHYRLEDRESGAKGLWKATPARVVKTPRVSLRDGQIKMIIISDDHTFDDADLGSRIVKDEVLRAQRLSGEYVNLFLEQLLQDPEYVPDRASDWGKMLNGFCLASTIRQILINEKPDLILFLGDMTGIGAAYKWKGLGLKDPAEILTLEEYDEYARLFWLRTRRILSGLTPSIPVYIALGNHDGESGFDILNVPAKKYRKMFFKMPGSEQGGSPDENYYPLIWNGDLINQGGFLFTILDSESASIELKRPEDWKLGTEQKEWFKEILKYETDWKFVFFHHVLGGWPRGTSEQIFDYVYGRGPLFTYEDYVDYCQDPNSVEQVELTKLMKENGVRINFYGHDHIFHVKEIDKRKMYGICVGSTKNYSELSWYKGELWQKHYGNYGYFWSENIETGEKADFWSPSGYTKLTINKDGAKVEYKRGGYNHPSTNIPPEIGVGDTISALLL